MDDDKPKRAKKSLLASAFGVSFLSFAALAALAGLIVFWLQGSDHVVAALESDLNFVQMMIPNIIGAVFLATFLSALVPQNFLERLIGEDSGLRGMAVGTAAGAMTPGGPMASFPLVLVLRRAGAGQAPMISYLTSWSTLGLHRILVWEIQFLGLEFALVRMLSSAPLPIIAGIASRFMPTAPVEPAAEPTKPADTL
jgi:uncharacterized membrane protein YraQ (UPF0718 family)